MTHHSHKSQDDYGLSFLAGLIMGGLAGALAGMLYAPKSGSQLRDDLSALPQKLGDDFTDPQGKTRRIINKTRANLEHQVERAQDARQARKMAKAKQLEDMASGYDLN